MPDYDDNFDKTPEQDVLDDFSEPDQQTPEDKQREGEELIQKIEEEGSVDVDIQEPRLTSKEKKKNRYKEAWRRVDAAEERVQRLEQEISDLRNQQRSYQAPQPPKEEKDEIQNQLETVYNQRSQIQQLFAEKSSNNTLTPEDQSKMIEQDRKLFEEQNRLFYKKFAKEHAKEQPPQQDPGTAALQSFLRMQYSDVMGNERARLYADTLYRQMTLRGDPASMETVKRAIEQTRTDLKLPGYRNYEASDIDKQRMSGPPMRGSSNNSTKSAPRIHIDKTIQKMANSMYSHLPTEAERVQKWIDEIGPEYVKDLTKT